MLDPFFNPFQPGRGPSLSDIFKRPQGGGIRPRKVEKPPEVERESEALGPEEETVETAGPVSDRVVLKNPRWETDKVGFNEEADISVEAELPEPHAHKTKVDFELFAKTPDGPESISKCQGHIQDGKATGRIPVYFPQYKDEEGNLLAQVEYYFTAKQSQSDLLRDDTLVKRVDQMAERLIQNRTLEDLTFAAGRSFLRPGHAGTLKAMGERIREWKAAHPDGKLALFGHADAVGKENANKTLSECRARSLYAVLTGDAGIWNALYDDEKWGLSSTQELLQFLGHDPGPVDGQKGPRTQEAVKAFQGKMGLASSGEADARTREALYREFFAACAPDGRVPKDFDAIDGKPYAGCSEFNRVENSSGTCPTNRRVAVLLLKSNRNFPIQYPCKQGDITPCRKQTDRKGERRTAGFGCLFYDKLVQEEKAGVPIEAAWSEAPDYSDLPEPWLPHSLASRVSARQGSGRTETADRKGGETYPLATSASREEAIRYWHQTAGKAWVADQVLESAEEAAAGVAEPDEEEDDE